MYKQTTGFCHKAQYTLKEAQCMIVAVTVQWLTIVPCDHDLSGSNLNQESAFTQVYLDFPAIPGQF